MRILLFGNGWVACEIARHLREIGDEIVGLVAHPPERARHGDELRRASGVEPGAVVDGSTLRSPETAARLRGFAAEIGVAAYFGYIVPPDVLALPGRGIVNVHPALLPFNRGAFPNVWSILERTPAGVTLHWMDRGIDTGPIIAQRSVPVGLADTGATLYRKLEGASLELFRETWPAVRSGASTSHPQPDGGTVHRLSDVAAVDRIELDRRYTARDLIDLLRARTFPPHRGAYFEEGGRRIYLRLELEDAASVEGPGPGAESEPAAAGEPR